MALGGGKFTSQNKVLPGAYINFVSASGASAVLSDRGVVAMPLSLDWGVESAIFEVTRTDFIKDSLKIFGYAYTDDGVKNIRELFKHATKLYAYRLTSGGTKASNTFADAKWCGTRGNQLKTVIATNVEDATKFDVSTYFGTELVDKQMKVTDVAGLVNTDWCTWKSGATLAVTAGTPFTGGTNGTATGTTYSNFLTAVDPYAFNVLALDSTDSTTKALFATYIETRRDEYGKKSQLVLYNQTADYEGVINVKNTVSDTGASASCLVYWVAGLEAGCEVNKSCTNALYDGEYNVTANYTQAQLESFLLAGNLVLHNVGNEVRVLSDVNSLTTATESKGDIFKKNQTIRVIDQIANDVATVFSTKYLGNVPNDADGRISLWSDIVKLHNELLNLRAIDDFDEEDITVAKGQTSDSVVVTDAVTVANAMEKLYMTVTVQ